MGSLTKFHWAVSKLPGSLMDTVCALCNDPTNVADPHGKLHNILLQSYCFTCLLDHPGLKSNKPSVLVDHAA